MRMNPHSNRYSRMSSAISDLLRTGRASPGSSARDRIAFRCVISPRKQAGADRARHGRKTMTDTAGSEQTTIETLLEPGTGLTRLGEGYQFTEGPVWSVAEQCLYF